MKVIEVIMRVIVSPLILSIAIIYHSLFIIVFMFRYIVYGGELITYKNDDRAYIVTIYEELKRSKEEKQ